MMEDEQYQQALELARQYQISKPTSQRVVSEAEEILEQYRFDRFAGTNNRGATRWLTFVANKAGNSEAANRWALL